MLLSIIIETIKIQMSWMMEVTSAQPYFFARSPKRQDSSAKTSDNAPIKPSKMSLRSRILRTNFFFTSIEV